jgi:hypothetical protein
MIPNTPRHRRRLIAERCGQIKEFRDTKGNIPNPQWVHVLQVLYHCEDGEELAHEWGSGYKGATYEYTREETSAVLARMGQFGPTTCEKFHEVKKEICEGCPHWDKGKINSPIVLGRRDEAGAPAGKEAGEDGPVQFADFYAQTGLPKPSFPNTLIALRHLGLGPCHDTFKEQRLLTTPSALEPYLGRKGPYQVDDPVCRALRELIHERHRFDPEKHIWEAIQRACEQHSFNPVADLIDSFQWME